MNYITNPFFFGNPTPPNLFVGRRQALRRVCGRLLHHGQSSALVGEPRSGKTSLLYYISSPETSESLYGENAPRLRFAYFDALSLDEQFFPKTFWERAFIPLLNDASTYPSLAAALKTCGLNKYDNFSLVGLFQSLAREGLSLILLLDELDVLVEHPAFRQTEFWGGLRNLASLSSALSLVTASRQSLAVLNRRTQQLSGNGSPFFNILEEVPLGGLTLSEQDVLLELGKKRLSTRDQLMLKTLAGSHPYLLQVAASALWDAIDDFPEEQERYRHTVNFLYEQVHSTLQDSWRLWSPEMKKVATIVALQQLPGIISHHEFDISALERELPDYERESRELMQRGFLQLDMAHPGRFVIAPGIFLLWLGTEWAGALRRNDDLSGWLADQGWHGLLKGGEKRQMVSAVREMGKTLQGGLTTLVQAAATGWAAQITK